ncbi:hypothetical protein C8J56DRAFT_381336 [Mycena floridula]|nr:hypothetical protein C8J56DRAFT_381336 [Mycena floridula]
MRFRHYKKTVDRREEISNLQRAEDRARVLEESMSRPCTLPQNDPEHRLMAYPSGIQSRAPQYARNSAFDVQRSPQVICRQARLQPCQGPSSVGIDQAVSDARDASEQANVKLEAKVEEDIEDEKPVESGRRSHECLLRRAVQNGEGSKLASFEQILTDADKEPTPNLPRGLVESARATPRRLLSLVHPSPSGSRPSSPLEASSSKRKKEDLDADEKPLKRTRERAYQWKGDFIWPLVNV